MIDKYLNIPSNLTNSGFFHFQQSIYSIFGFAVFMFYVRNWNQDHQKTSTGNNENLGKKKVVNQSHSKNHKNTTREDNHSINKKASFDNQVHPETRKRAIAFAGYDKGRIERLLNSVRLNNPNRSEQWYWEKILYDMERDRGF